MFENDSYTVETKTKDNHRSSKRNQSKNKSKRRKSKILQSMPTRSEISLEKMISLAKIHREANRPLVKIKEFDNKTKFCQCCSLPAKDDIYLRNCSFCENTDKFAEYGRGTSLYFSFFRFSILIMSFCLACMALPCFLLTENYTMETSDLCSNIYNNLGTNITEYFNECINFISVDGISEYLINGMDWEFRYNSRNLITYTDIHKKIYGSKEKINKIVINLNYAHLIGLICLFIINVLYIILLENINKQYDMDVTSPGDFTIIITNLYTAFEIFWKNIKIINDKIKKGYNDNNRRRNAFNIEESKNQEGVINYHKEMKEAEEIGLEEIPKNEEVNVLEAFNQFIKNKICTIDDKNIIYHINICYKINDFMEIQEKIQNIKKEIFKINNEKFQIIKNHFMGLDNENRRFFYNPLDVLDLNLCQGECCERYHVLSDLIDDKSKSENKLKELLEKTKTLTEENFAGVIFVTFNTIEQHENFLKRYPSNFCMKIFINIKDIKYFLCCCCMKKSKRKMFFLQKNLSVEEAPEPEDVIFENLQYSSCARLIRTLFILFYF